jgi:hypothetical protein
MDRADVKDMFVDSVGGTSLEDSTIERILIDSLTLLDQLTARQDIDFVNDSPVLVMQTMQYYYDLAQRNFASAKDGLAAVVALVTQFNHDYVQVEQAERVNYMGGEVETSD